MDQLMCLIANVYKIDASDVRIGPKSINYFALSLTSSLIKCSPIVVWTNFIFYQEGV